MRALLIADKDRAAPLLPALVTRGYLCNRAWDLQSLRQAGHVSGYGLLIIDLSITSFDVLKFLESCSRYRKPIPTIVLANEDTLVESAKAYGFDDESILRGDIETQGFIHALEALNAHTANEEEETRALGGALEIEPLRTSSYPPVIVLATHKGGTGKTTVAMHLIAGLLHEGLKVASIDLDQPQLSLSRYLENRAAYARNHGIELPMPSHRAWDAEEDNPISLWRHIEKMRGEAKTVIVDCPAGQSALGDAAIEVAACLVTPINDSFMDLDLLAVLEAKNLSFRRLGSFGEMVANARNRRRQQVGSGIEWLVLRNRLSSIGSQNKERLADVLVELAPRMGFRHGTGLSERVIYREMFLDGLTLLDLRREGIGHGLSMSHVSARQELRKLFEDIRKSEAAPNEDRLIA
jgi:chromosome partitioning protein